MGDDTSGLKHAPVTLAESLERYGPTHAGAEAFLTDYPHLVANTSESNRDPSPTHYPDGSTARARARAQSPALTPAPASPAHLPHDNRKAIPLARGLLDYFPAALAEVARLSLIGAEKHNGGKLAWNRAASDDHADALMRHLIDRDHIDDDGIAHAVKVAWRGLAMAQLVLEKEKARNG